MDPLTAFSLAGTIVQFVDFGSKLYSKSLELYKSTTGALTANNQLELIISEFTILNDKLRAESASDGVAGCLTKEEDVLLRLYEECGTICGELLEDLDALKVRGHHKAWKSVWKAIASAWTAEERTSKVRQLDQIRQTLEFQVLVGLR
jgi:hypothetical protein